MATGIFVAAAVELAAVDDAFVFIDCDACAATFDAAVVNVGGSTFSSATIVEEIAIEAGALGVEAAASVSAEDFVVEAVKTIEAFNGFDVDVVKIVAPMIGGGGFEEERTC